VESPKRFATESSPTGDNFITGSRSAIAGGTTTVSAFASQRKSDVSVIPTIEDYHTKAKGKRNGITDSFSSS
jgi:dihydropyrimidinase